MRSSLCKSKESVFTRAFTGPMYFRLRTVVKGLRVETDVNSVLSFVVNAPPVSVELRGVTQAEISQGVERASCIATASAERRPNERVFVAFKAMSDGCVPQGSKDINSSAWSGYLDEHGALSRETRLPIPTELLPDGVQSSVNQIREQLYGAVHQVIDIFRWRMAIPGPSAAIMSSLKGAEWSIDGEVWHTLPASMSFEIRSTPKTVVDKELLESLRILTKELKSEPTGHVLLREAWELRRTHLRSSLLTGIAALEVGFKDFAAERLPDAEWLLVNMPSPSLVRMLKEYLPRMKVNAAIDGQVIPPPESVLSTVEKGVTARNEVAHSKALNLKSEMVEETLLAVRDVLWLLDYYRGHQWAWSHIRKLTREQLTTKVNPQGFNHLHKPKKQRD